MVEILPPSTADALYRLSCCRVALTYHGITSLEAWDAMTPEQRLRMEPYLGLVAAVMATRDSQAMDALFGEQYGLTWRVSMPNYGTHATRVLEITYEVGERGEPVNDAERLVWAAVRLVTQTERR